MCHIVPICHFFGGLKGFLIHFVSHHSYLCGVEVYHTHTHRTIHTCTMLLVYYIVAVVNIGCREGKNCGRLVGVAFVTVVLVF